MRDERRTADELAKRIRRGDERACGELVDLLGGRVHALARRYADTPSDAEDLTQEIFIDLFRCLGAFRGESALTTWVYRIAMNHCLRFREKRRPVTVCFDDAIMIDPDPASDPACAAVRVELSARIHEALDTLPEPQRDVVLLHELHGLTYGECAQALNVPVGTVKSRLFNAFRRLRVNLGDYVHGDSPRAVGAEQ